MQALPQAKAQSEMVALFVSDLHLQESLPRTTEKFLAFLQRDALRSRQLYLLGDIFEAWAGDDDIDSPCNRLVTDALRHVSLAGVEVFWMAGNRDFLAGERFARTAGLTLLPDPHVVTIAGLRIALAHGDAQCTDDHAYLAFRAQVRNPSWQADFLAQPLPQRKKIIEDLRTGSREANRNKPAEIMDVNQSAIDALFDATGTDILIHGHTHRPARHESNGKVRYVLPDWDCDDSSLAQARGGWLGIGRDGVIRRFDVDGVEQE